VATYGFGDGGLIIEPVPSLEDLLPQPPEVGVTQGDLEKERRGLSREAER